MSIYQSDPFLLFTRHDYYRAFSLPLFRQGRGRVEEALDVVASELPVSLIVNNEPLVTFLCTPSELRELAVGFLLSEGILRAGSSITNLDVDAGQVMDLEDIRRQLETFRGISSLYLETGGVHSAAISIGKDILFFPEDIGRHNAVDKLIGKAFCNRSLSRTKSSLP